MTSTSIPHSAPSPDLPPARRDSSGLIDLRLYANAGRDAREEMADEILGVGVLSPLAPTFAPPPASEGRYRALMVWNAGSSLVALGALALAWWALAGSELAAYAPAPAEAVDEAAAGAPDSAQEPTAPRKAPQTPDVAPPSESAEPSSPPAPRNARGPSPQSAPRPSAPVAASGEQARPTPATPEPVPAAALPETPTRAQVASTLRGASGAVAQCFAPYEHGVIQTTIAIDGPSGRVRHALVTGGFAGTPAGSCVARTLREVRFSPFARERLEVAFPYRI